MLIDSLLKKIPFFSQIPDDVIKKIQNSGTIEELPVGHVICREGDETNSMYLILKGDVRIYKQDDQGLEIEMAVLKAGSFLGELAFLDNNPRSADVACITDVELFTLVREDFLKLLENHPEIIRSVIISLTSKLREKIEDDFTSKLSKERLRSQAEVERHRSLSLMVAGVAHEINNPIGAVSSANNVIDRCIDKIETELQQSETLEDFTGGRAYNNLREILRENSAIVASASERITTIVTSLRNFVRLDEAEYQQVDIHEGINSTLTLLESRYKGRIEVTTDYGDLPEIRCFPGQLNQVFMNLLKNAVQAIEGVGTIHIQTSQKAKSIQVAFTDSGVGIGPEKLKKLFDFGFSQDNDRVKMGAGLASSMNIIKKHAGTITVKSEVGSGSTFTIEIPVQ